MSKKKKVAIITPSISVGFVVNILLDLILTRYFVGWGSFAKMDNIRFDKKEAYLYDFVN